MGEHVARLTPVGMTLVEVRRADLGLGPDADWASRVTDEWLRWELDGPGTGQGSINNQGNQLIGSRALAD